MRSLERRLDEERESRRRAATIIVQLTQANAALAARVPELEPPREQPEASETAEEQQGRGVTPPRCPWRSGGHTAPVVEAGVRRVSQDAL